MSLTKTQQQFIKDNEKIIEVFIEVYGVIPPEDTEAAIAEHIKGVPVSDQENVRRVFNAFRNTYTTILESVPPEVREALEAIVVLARLENKQKDTQ